VVVKVTQGGSEQLASETVQVRLFALLQDRAGWSARELPLPADSCLSALDVWNRLNLGPWSASLRVAINQNLVEPQQRVHPGDELAFLPPFTGG
jgi:molybdopterin synthase sulfur carrier subunit